MAPDEFGRPLVDRLAVVDEHVAHLHRAPAPVAGVEVRVDDHLPRAERRTHVQYAALVRAGGNGEAAARFIDVGERNPGGPVAPAALEMRVVLVRRGRVFVPAGEGQPHHEMRRAECLLAEQPVEEAHQVVVQLERMQRAQRQLPVEDLHERRLRLHAEFGEIGLRTRQRLPRLDPARIGHRPGYFGSDLLQQRARQQAPDEDVAIRLRPLSQLQPVVLNVRRVGQRPHRKALPRHIGMTISTSTRRDSSTAARSWNSTLPSSTRSRSR